MFAPKLPLVGAGEQGGGFGLRLVQLGSVLALLQHQLLLLLFLLLHSRLQGIAFLFGIGQLWREDGQLLHQLFQTGLVLQQVIGALLRIDNRAYTVNLVAFRCQPDLVSL